MLYDVRMLFIPAQDLDTRITTTFVRVWGRRPTLDALFVTISAWTPMLMVALIAVAVFGISLTAREGAEAVGSGGAAIFAAIVARLINEPLGAVFHRLRPFQMLGFVPLVPHDPGTSFPSNHATGAFALAVCMLSVPGYGPILLLLAVGLTVSRVYVGLHYMTDVVAGALNGLLAAWLTLWSFQTLHIVGMLSAL